MPGQVDVRLIGLVLALLLARVEAQAASCTQGSSTDPCFCDCVNDTDGAGNNVTYSGIVYANEACHVALRPIHPHTRSCMDFEEITLWDGRGTGANGATGPGSGPTACVPGNDAANCYANTSPPLYGPPYDPTGGNSGGSGVPPYTAIPHLRGANSLYSGIQGTTSASVVGTFMNSNADSWGDGTPASPTYGWACDDSGGNRCNNIPAVWAADNRWGGNATAEVGVLRANEVTQDHGPSGEATITEPSTVYDGKQVWGNRYRKSVSDSSPHWATVSFPTPVATVKIAHAFAFTDNFTASNILSWPLKQDELDGNVGHMCNMWTDDPPNAPSSHALFPFSRLGMFAAGGAFNQGSCDTFRAGITRNLGTSSDDECISSGTFRYWPDPSLYSQPADFPFGTYHVSRCVLTGLNTSNGRVEIWIDSKKIIDLAGINFAGMYTGGGSGPVTSWWADRFPNGRETAANNGNPDGTGLNVTTWQLDDNYLIESCTASEYGSDPTGCSAPPTLAEISGGGGGTPGAPTLCCRQ